MQRDEEGPESAWVEPRTNSIYTVKPQGKDFNLDLLDLLGGQPKTNAEQRITIEDDVVNSFGDIVHQVVVWRHGADISLWRNKAMGLYDVDVRVEQSSRTSKNERTVIYDVTLPKQFQVDYAVPSMHIQVDRVERSMRFVADAKESCLGMLSSHSEMPLEWHFQVAQVLPPVLVLACCIAGLPLSRSVALTLFLCPSLPPSLPLSPSLSFFLSLSLFNSSISLTLICLILLAVSSLESSESQSLPANKSGQAHECAQIDSLNYIQDIAVPGELTFLEISQ